jgi:hypothetical protein
MELDSLTSEQRARIAAPLRRFNAAMREQRAFDDKVAAAIERLFARDPAFRQRLAALDSQFKQRISNDV